ncbi:MAG: recombinase family protein, partial [Cyanobacteria bacterium P01_F01_bin.42]
MPLFAHSTPIDIERIETVTRSQLLRATAESAAKCIRSGEVKPEEIAIIGPGLDSLARYALIDIIEAQGIPVVSWKEQRPLYASALVRSLLSLLAFVYQDLGRQLSRDSVAEMIEVMANIDAVRAGLLADYCFRPDTHCPLLLPLEKFPRWDRVGNQAAQDYDRLRHWIKRAQQPSRSPPECLSQAIAFFWSERSFRYDESAALRELLETSQHFAKIGDRLQQTPSHSTLNAFISVIKQGT